MEIQQHEEGGVLTVRFSGSLGFQDHMSFNEFMNSIKDQKRTVSFDLTNLEMIDSAGIGMLFLAKKLVEQSHGELILKNPRGQVKRVFEITSIGKQISITEDA